MTDTQAVLMIGAWFFCFIAFFLSLSMKIQNPHDWNRKWGLSAAFWFIPFAILTYIMEH